MKTRILDFLYFFDYLDFLVLAGMLLFLQLHLRLLSARSAVFHEFAEVALLRLQNTNGAAASVAFCTVAGVDGFLTSWHSRSSLLKRW